MEEKISIPVVLAGISIEIKTAFPGIRPFFAAYMPEDPAGFAPAFTAESTEELREFYRNDYFETCEREGRKPPAKTPWNMIETIALHDRITRKLLEKDIFLMHGSAIAVDGECYLFTAPSGTGKSTHTRLWREYFGDRAVMVNDDKPYLYRKNDRVPGCSCFPGNRITADGYADRPDWIGLFGSAVMLFDGFKPREPGNGK